MSSENKLNKSSLFPLIPAVAFLFILFVYPFLYGIYLSFTMKNGQFTIGNYLKFFSDMWELRTIWVTLIISLPVTLISVAIAVPFAYYMRRGLRAEKIITFFLILPVTLGTVLVAEGMLTYMGPKGWVNQFLMAIHLVNAPIQLTHNHIGVIISLFIQGFPFAFLMMLGYISGISPELEKAARMLGANERQTFWKIMFPLMTPGIAISFCLSFVMAFSVFPSAVLLGQPSGPTRVIAFAAYQWAFEKFDFNMGSTICMVMALIEVIIIGIVLYWRGRIYKGASIVGKG